MNSHFPVKAAEKMKRPDRWFFTALCWLALSGITAEAAQGTAAVHGLIYISPSGKLEGDLVMRAAGVEVILLPGEGKLEAELEAIRESRWPTITAQLQTVTRVQAEFVRSVTSPKEDKEKRSETLRRERAKLADLREAYGNDVNQVIARHALSKTKTDAEGKFSFAAIPAGRYIIHAHFEIVGMDLHHYWLLPVEAQSGKESEVSLTKLNTTPLF